MIKRSLSYKEALKETTETSEIINEKQSWAKFRKIIQKTHTPQV